MKISIGELTGLRKPLPCHRKQQYRSKGAAEAHLRSLLKRPDHVRDPDLLNAYECPFCTFYHVGRRKPEEAP